ncbi:transporter substrate-binding domain-containing protein [Oxalobacteraceae bacterium]|nr:transporter substrate-binding domain-containing protein [Oxalobacteraceae bacterium]
MKRIFLSVLFSLWAASAAAESVLIGAEDDWAPYSAIVDGEARGFAVDVVREAFAAVGVQAHFEVLPYVRCMAMAKAGQLIGCFDAVPNHLIDGHYLWHAQPLFRARMNVYALASSREHGLSAQDFEGKTVGVTRDYEYGDEFDLNTRIRREVAARNEQGFRKLLAGRMQYMAAEERIAKALFARYPAFAGKFREVGTVATPGLYVAFTKSVPQGARYLNKFNEGYAIIVRNGRYKALENKWF